MNIIAFEMLGNLVMNNCSKKLITIITLFIDLVLVLFDIKIMIIDFVSSSHLVSMSNDQVNFNTPSFNQIFMKRISSSRS